MSNDYALFIIIVPNDFDLETSVVSTTAPTNMMARKSITSSDNTFSGSTASASAVPRKSIMLSDNTFSASTAPTSAEPRKSITSFDNTDRVLRGPANAVIRKPIALSDNTVSALMIPAAIPLSAPSFINSPSRRESESNQFPMSQPLSSLSICALLKNYLADRSDLQAVWIMSDNKKTFQITFHVEFGLVSDRMLQDLAKLTIGKRNGTQVSVIPTTIVLKEHCSNEKNESPSSSCNALEDTNAVADNKLSSVTEESNGTSSHDLTLSNKILKRIRESDFKKSVRARLMVHQVVASIRASSAVSFDFVLLICLASMLAAFGLLENSTVIIVASMLVSPLMNPILGVVFGLSIRDNSLWRRGLRNEIIGLIICISCGFFIGLFTTFFETKWRSSSSFPTSEMRSRGDITRLWVGVFIALPSGAGVALSVLGGNTGSLVGVAISASLLPPAVNCGLLFAYSLLGRIFSNVAVTQSSSSDSMNRGSSSLANCVKYIDNDYQPLYTCKLSTEAAILACGSLLLTIVNIVCIVLMALIILRIKEVVPLNQANKDIANFFRYDVKVARDYNKTIHGADGANLTATGLRHHHLAQSIVNRWKGLKSSSASVQQQQELSTSIDTDLELANHVDSLFPTDAESQRKLLRLKTFAREYDLDVLNPDDYNLTNYASQEKVRLLISDLVDMCQEIPSVFVDLYRLQPSGTQSSADKQHMLFYQEMIELLPPKWYQLFKYERQRRCIAPWPPALNRSYSTSLHPSKAFDNSLAKPNQRRLHQSLKKQNKKSRVRLFRQNSVPTSDHRSTTTEKTSEVPVKGTRFRISKPTIIEIHDNESKPI